MHLAFLSGNEAYWKVRFEATPNSAADDQRVMVIDISAAHVRFIGVMVHCRCATKRARK